MIGLGIFGVLRSMLVAFTGRGYDRGPAMNRLHHKLSYRLHRLLPKFGITGLQRVKVPGLEGRHMYVRAEDGGVAHQLIMYHVYEPFETELVRGYLKPGMTVWNVGANLGYYTLVASSLVGDRGRVYAFEPAPENLALLERTVAENRATNVIVVGSAIGTADGSANLAISDRNSGDHQLRAVEGRRSVSVEVRSVDSLVEAGFAPPEAIIMDVQGSELDAFRGMKAVLASGAPMVIFTEYWPSGLDERAPGGADELLQMLVESGFALHIIDEGKQRMTAASIQDIKHATRLQPEINLLAVRH